MSISTAGGPWETPDYSGSELTVTEPGTYQYKFTMENGEESDVQTVVFDLCEQT
jgi:hypothetical protein